VGLFSKFLWKLRLFRAVSGGGPKSLRERRRDVFVKLSGFCRETVGRGRRT
jgi:hypothetical protein